MMDKLEFIPRTFYWSQRESQVFFDGKVGRYKTKTCYSYISYDNSATFDLPKTFKPLEKSHLTEGNQHFKRKHTSHTHTHLYIHSHRVLTAVEG